MITQETINKLKQIPIVEYLMLKGHQPATKYGEHYMYQSPLRKDTTPSFSINTHKNVFYDFGNPSDKGGIIDLVMKLERLEFPYACAFLSSNFNIDKIENISFFYSCHKRSNVNGIKVLGDKALRLKYLVHEIELRKIRAETAKNYLKEIYWETCDQKKYHGYGYKTDKGVYVVRNKYIQKFYFLGVAGITTFGNDKNTVSIFEGMFDFLSHLEILNTSELDHKVIILNSVNNLHFAQEALRNAKNVHCYLDNDKSGRNALNQIKNLAETKKINVIDHSDLYTNFKDYNEFYMSQNIK